MRELGPRETRAGTHREIPKPQAGNILTSRKQSVQRVAWDLERFPL
jgi:hypothetical protein